MIVETKYDPTDIVWIMIGNKPKECVIFEVQPGIRTKAHAYQNKYTIDGYNGGNAIFFESDIFRTKEELINSL